MATLCPFCNTEVRESEIEAEDGCCPECGAQIATSSPLELENEEERQNEWDDDERELCDEDGNFVDEDGDYVNDPDADGEDGFPRNELNEDELFDDDLDSEFPEDYREEFAEDEEEF